MRTIVSFDILRFLAAIAVVFYHFYYYGGVETSLGGIGEILGPLRSFDVMLPFTWWGWVGVYAFFVISGFVIIMSAEGKTPREFLIGRFTRLFPALFFFMTLALFVVLLVSSIPGGTAFLRWARAVTLFPKGPWIDGAVWTLTIEIVFYAGIMLILLVGRIKRIFLIARACAIASIILWVAVYAHRAFDFGDLGQTFGAFSTSYTAKFTLMTTGAFFATGIVLYEIYRYGSSKGRYLYLATLIASCSAALYVFAEKTPGVVLFNQSPWVPVLVWVVTVIGCFIAVLCEPHLSISQRYQNAARNVGLITYPLYLINQITGAFIVKALILIGLSHFWAPLLGIVIILMVSFCFSYWVEPPCRQRLIRCNLIARRALQLGR